MFGTQENANSQMHLFAKKLVLYSSFFSTLSDNLKVFFFLVIFLKMSTSCFLFYPKAPNFVSFTVKHVSQHTKPPARTLAPRNKDLRKKEPNQKFYGNKRDNEVESYGHSNQKEGKQGLHLWYDAI